VVAVLLLAAHIGTRALWDPDEGRYAEMGREVLVLKDWVSPHLNYLLYFEKPMLFIWMEAVSQKIFGVNEAGARTTPLACAFGIVFLVWLVASRQWGRRAGLVASVVLITSLEFFVLANAVDINMPLALFVTAALAFFWLGHFQNRPGYYYLAWVCAGLAALTKGPIGLILPLAAVLVYLVATRQFKLLIQAKPLTGLLVFLAVTLPWYVLVCHRNPDFFDFFFINQNLMRYTTNIHQRYQPFWYFIPVIVGGFLPWTFLLPAAIKRMQLSRRTIPNPIWYIIIWFAVTFFFFTPSQSKLATYILPCFAPLALLIGYAFRDTDQEADISIYPIAALWALIGMALIIFPLIAPWGIIPHVRHPEYLTPLLKYGSYMGAIIMAGVLVGIITARKIGAVPGYAILGLALMVVGLTFAGSWDQIKSTKAILKDLPPDAQLYAYSKYFQSSTFYARRPVRLVGNMGELTFGQTHDNSHTIDKGVFLDLMHKGGHIYCLTETDHATEITDRAPSARVIAQKGELVLIESMSQNVKTTHWQDWLYHR
jgi:4-amino-4-deoxy-L-arabinose transferase-like glycosyltransferase